MSNAETRSSAIGPWVCLGAEGAQPTNQRSVVALGRLGLAVLVRADRPSPQPVCLPGNRAGRGIGVSLGIKRQAAVAALGWLMAEGLALSVRTLRGPRENAVLSDEAFEHCRFSARSLKSSLRRPWASWAGTAAGVQGLGQASIGSAAVGI